MTAQEKAARAWLRAHRKEIPAELRPPWALEPTQRGHRGHTVAVAVDPDSLPAGGDPLDALLLDAERTRDDADAWLMTHEPRGRRSGTSERTQERMRAEERALMAAIARSAARFAASAGRGRIGEVS